MLPVILFGVLKQIGHALLGQPDRLILQAHFDFDLAVIGLIVKELPFAGSESVRGYQFFGHDCTTAKYVSSV